MRLSDYDGTVTRGPGWSRGSLVFKINSVEYDYRRHKIRGDDGQFNGEYGAMVIFTHNDERYACGDAYESHTVDLRHAEMRDYLMRVAQKKQMELVNG